MNEISEKYNMDNLVPVLGAATIATPKDHQFGGNQLIIIDQ